MTIAYLLVAVGVWILGMVAMFALGIWVGRDQARQRGGPQLPWPPPMTRSHRRRRRSPRPVHTHLHETALLPATPEETRW